MLSVTTSLPRPVEVLHHGCWVPGSMEACRRDGDGWRAFVRYRTGPGETYLSWRTEDEVRAARA